MTRPSAVESKIVRRLDQPGSKVRPVRDGLAMFLDLLAVRRRAAQGLYESRYPVPAADRLLNRIEPTPVR